MLLITYLLVPKWPVWLLPAPHTSRIAHTANGGFVDAPHTANGGFVDAPLRWLPEPMHIWESGGHSLGSRLLPEHFLVPSKLPAPSISPPRLPPPSLFSLFTDSHSTPSQIIPSRVCVYPYTVHTLWPRDKAVAHS